jgi:hypothetical protein
MIEQIERRYYPAEMRVDAQAGTIEGYAAVFNQQSEDLGGFTEDIRKGAFSKTIKEGDVRALFNHDPNYVLGRNKAGTLSLAEDAHGLQFQVKPPDTAWAKDLRETIRRGDVDQASFGFTTIKDDWNEATTPRQRTLLEVRLYDVSVVTFPAYPQTSVSARSLAEMLIASFDKLRMPEDRELLNNLKLQLSLLEQTEEPVQEDHSSDLDARARTRQVNIKRRLELLKLRLI